MTNQYFLFFFFCLIQPILPIPMSDTTHARICTEKLKTTYVCTCMSSISPTFPVLHACSSQFSCIPLKCIPNPHLHNSRTASWTVTGGRKQKHKRDHTYRKNCGRTKKKKRSNKRKKAGKKYKISIPTSNITLSSTQPVSTTNITFF
jgi:hypothetical protein